MRVGWILVLISSNARLRSSAAKITTDVVPSPTYRLMSILERREGILGRERIKNSKLLICLGDERVRPALYQLGALLPAGGGLWRRHW